MSGRAFPAASALALSLPRGLVAALAVAYLMLSPPSPAGSVPLQVVVNSTNDPGDGVCTPAECTLAEAITEANAVGDPDIVFGIPDSDPGKNPDGTFTIYTNGLPTITSETRIDATTQMGYAGKPLIELNGTLAPPGTDGFQIKGKGVAVKGFAITFFGGAGIHVIQSVLNSDEGREAVIQSNFIGTDVTGTIDQGNGYGVLIEGADEALIGGDSAAERNLISGNDRDGVLIRDYAQDAAISGRVQRNHIGTDVSGQLPLPNSESGVHLLNAGFWDIGGESPSVRNVISGNLKYGIEVNGYGFHRISENYVGTTADGDAPLHNLDNGVVIVNSGNNRVGDPGLGNVLGDGLAIVDGSHDTLVRDNHIGVSRTGVPLGNPNEGVFMFLTFDNTIGGTAPNEGNVIAHNSYTGIDMTAVGASATVGNRILGNSIYSNGGGLGFGLGIDIAGFGVSPNDAGDADANSNHGQNYPVLTLVQSGSLLIQGTLNSTPERDFRIEFFANEDCDASGYGEGETYLGFASAHTNGAGEAAVSFQGGPTVPAGHFVTATATDLVTNDTSEFSACREVEAGPTPTPAPTPTATPTPTPVATATATPAATPTGSPAGLIQGDVDCDGDADAVDALKLLRSVAGLDYAQNNGCPRIGAEVASKFGDVDCDLDVDAVDALKVLRYVAGLGYAQNEECADIGRPL